MGDRVFVGSTDQYQGPGLSEQATLCTSSFSFMVGQCLGALRAGRTVYGREPVARRRGSLGLTRVNPNEPL